MRNSIVVVIYLFLISSAVFASPLTDMTLSVPLPIEAGTPLNVDDRPLPFEPIDVKTATPEEIMNAFSHLSSVPYFQLMKDLGIELPRQLPPVKTEESSEISLNAVPFSVLYTTNAVNDSAPDVEPTIISITKGGSVYTTTAYIKNPKEIARIHFSTSADPSSPNWFYKGQLPITAEYTYSADPLAAQNGRGSGIYPGRQYIAGIIYNPSSPVGYGVPNSIAVWRSDNGGYNWTLAEAVRNNNSSYFLDKPAIAVSEHYATRGYVYIAFVRHEFGGSSQSQLYVARSTNGGVSFQMMNYGLPLYVGRVNGAQILVNPFYGHVYVFGVDFENNFIGSGTSYDYGVNWIGPEVVATGDLLGGGSSDYLNGGVKAGTLPMARFNWVANKICIVWHEDVNPSTSVIDADVFFTSKSPGGGWITKKRINDDTTSRDQFMPALDFDSSGNLTVVFYDRRNDVSNLKFREYMARIDANGNNIRTNKQVSPFDTNPNDYDYNFIGDYHDIWSWPRPFPYYGEIYNSSWVGRYSGDTLRDIYISGIEP